jgi:sulfatase modifying factor 1
MKKLLLFTLLVSQFLFPQLKEMEVKPTENRGQIPIFRDHPDKVAMIFYTQFDNLSFYSSYGIIETTGDQTGGKYILIIEPTRQAIEVRCSGFKTEIIKLGDIQPRDVLYYEVLPKKEEGIQGVSEIAITVQTTPVDAIVTLDGAPFSNNVSTIVSLGKHRLRVAKAGYSTIDQEIIVSPEKNLFPVELQKVSLSPVTIKSIPPDAAVYIDNDLKGTTELGFFLYSGDYDLRIELPGFLTLQEVIKIRPSTSNSDNSFSFNLTKNKGFLSLQVTPSSASVLINGEEKPYSSKMDLTPGAYTLTVKANQYSSFTEQIEIKLGETITKVINLEKNTGQLVLKTDPPNATIKVNKEIRKVGNIELTPGVYEVEISAESCYPEIFTINVQKGTTVEKSVKLKQKNGAFQFTVKPLSAKSALSKNGVEILTWEGMKIIDPIVEGEYDLVVKAKGYRTITKIIKIKEANTTKEDVILKEGSDAPKGYILVEGGTFTMGSNDGGSDEKPTHRVTVSSFYIGKTEVTQDLWASVMGNNPSNFEDDNIPVEKVSWNDIVDFCNKLSEKEGLKKAYSGSGNNINCDFSSNGYRLPTEAEWEFTARGGNRSKGYEYSGSNKIDEVAWYDKNSGNETHDVGTKQANELGLYDMSGNVWEWVWDWYGEYSSGSQTNPKGANSGSNRVLRGGSWYSVAGSSRVAGRDYDVPDIRSSNVGFRLVRTK